MRSNSVLQLEDERPGLHQAAAWRDAVAPFWSFAIRKEDLAEFRGRSHVRHLGNAILCRASASGLQFTRDRALVARMGVDHVLAHVRLSGRSRVAVGGGEQACEPGDICLLDLSRPLSARSTDYQALTVVLPRGLFGPHQGALDALHGQVIRGATPFGRMLNDHLRALGAHAPGFSEREATAAAQATAMLLGAAVSGLPAEERVGRASDGAPLLLILRRFIEAELAAPGLNAETLGRQFGLSRSALYRLFAPLGGVSGYIRQRRLARAYQDLAACDGRGARVSEVAYRWGFESPAHFAQAFRAAFGHAPRDVRAQAPAPSPPEAAPDRPAPTESWPDFYDWVLRLAA
ncbi:helix-turn-helix domain-containing protein [Methylobacterium sp. E-005]|uniref:helix-turn-helix domain-containing protein n=1 Tax=Methylobacterium sp. E-005 TaxID=2836549 RepID=UPI001FBBF85D|nr:helix-turn-helix domain-containing protein [Methylobacterium sp. E-005]MCJ2085261.1 helix-turn-helix domain-containing protein [Methylobacterium sp. E-005]